MNYRVYYSSTRQPIDALPVHVFVRAYREVWQLLNAGEPVGPHAIERLDLLIEFAHGQQKAAGRRDPFRAPDAFIQRMCAEDADIVFGFYRQHVIVVCRSLAAADWLELNKPKYGDMIVDCQMTAAVYAWTGGNKLFDKLRGQIKAGDADLIYAICAE